MGLYFNNTECKDIYYETLENKSMAISTAAVSSTSRDPQIAGYLYPWTCRVSTPLSATDSNISDTEVQIWEPVDAHAEFVPTLVGGMLMIEISGYSTTPNKTVQIEGALFYTEKVNKRVEYVYENDNCVYPFKYDYDPDTDSYEISGCSTTNVAKNLVLPTSFNNKPVNYISSGAFNYTNLESITIPSSIKGIGSNNPFAYCESLKQITVEDEGNYFCSLEGHLYDDICEVLYCYCIGKTDTSYTLPQYCDAVHYYAFAGAPHLTTVTLNKNLRIIRDSAFYESSVTNVVIPSGSKLNQIDDFAFENGWLESINLDNATSLKTIGESAFACTGLSSITIPKSVTTIKPGAFQYCTLLDSITLGHPLWRIDGVVRAFETPTAASNALRTTYVDKTWLREQNAAANVAATVTKMSGVDKLDVTITNPNSVALSYDITYDLEGQNSPMINAIDRGTLAAGGTKTLTHYASDLYGQDTIFSTATIRVTLGITGSEISVTGSEYVPPTT